jgi:hypothetical protein
VLAAKLIPPNILAEHRARAAAAAAAATPVGGAAVVAIIGIWLLVGAVAAVLIFRHLASP